MISAKVMCITTSWANPLYANKIEFGQKLTVVWEGLAPNPSTWLNGQSEYCYLFAEIPPDPSIGFRALWNASGFVRLLE